MLLERNVLLFCAQRDEIISRFIKVAAVFPLFARLHLQSVML